MKIMKPATVMREFKLAATRVAAKTVVTVARVLSSVSSSIRCPKKEAARYGGRPYFSCCRSSRGFLVYLAQCHRVKLAIGRLFLV